MRKLYKPPHGGIRKLVDMAAAHARRNRVLTVSRS
jgi:hypothetical protein